MSGLSVADVLDRAADLIEPEGRWTQGELARDATRASTRPHSQSAVCFCAVGAISASRPEGNADLLRLSRNVLAKMLGVAFIGYWNDAPGRTQAEVVAKLREAAALARSQEAQS